MPLNDYQRNLVVQNRNLARRLAMYAWSRDFEGRDGDEAVAHAYMGLIAAASRFDPTRPEIIPGDLENGKAFSGYARQRIKGALMDWYKSQDHVSRNTRKAYRDLQKAGHGAGNDTDVVALAAGIDLDEARRVIAEVEAPPLLFDSSPSAHEVEESIAAVVLGPQDVEDDASMNMLLEAFARTWLGLPFVQRAAIANRLYFGHTLAETGKAVGVSGRRVGEDIDKGLVILVNVLRDAALDPAVD